MSLAAMRPLTKRSTTTAGRPRRAAPLLLGLALAGLLALPARAGVDEGAAAAARGDYAGALREWRPLAERGDAEAQWRLGALYFGGKGVARDDAQALAWFRKSATQDSPIGEYSLGQMYLLGRGVTKHDAEAIEWFGRAAEHDLREAEFALGQIEERGRIVVPQDSDWELQRARALEYAAEHPTEPGDINVNAIRSYDFTAAAEWYVKAAVQGHSGAALALAGLYARGRGVAKNVDEAARWYRVAAVQTDGSMPDNPAPIIAQLNLGLLYQQGQGLPQDDTTAAYWIRKSAEAGFAVAQLALADILDEGRGVPRAPEEAATWRRRAAELNLHINARAPTPPATPAK